MRTFEYCTNCREYMEFCEVEGFDLCSSCGEKLDPDSENIREKDENESQ